LFMEKNEENWPDCSEKPPNTYQEEVLPNTGMLCPMTARGGGRRVKSRAQGRAGAAMQLGLWV